MGRANEAGLQDLLSRHPLEGGEPGCPPSTPWMSRCGPGAMRRRARSGGSITSEPPLRRSAYRRLLWAYQLVAQLGFERDSWVAPVDARRVDRRKTPTRSPPCRWVAAARLPEPEALPIFVFDAFSTIR